MYFKPDTVVDLTTVMLIIPLSVLLLMISAEDIFEAFLATQIQSFRFQSLSQASK